MTISSGFSDYGALPNQPASPLPDASTQISIEVNDVLADAFSLLENSGCPWMLLRGEEDLARPSGDVDLLISEPLLPIIDRILEEAGFCRVLAHGHGTHRFYFRYVPDVDLWIKLDVVSDIAFGKFQELPTDLAAGCLQRRVALGPLRLPEMRDKAWLQILHLVLDKGLIAPERETAARAAAAVATASGPVASFLDGKFGDLKAQSLLDLLLCGNFQEVPATAEWMASNWSGHTSFGRRITSLSNAILRRVGPHLKGRGPVVGVLAPDGAGKTTLLAELGSHTPLPSRYVYMGLWANSPYDPYIRKVPGGVLARKVFRILRGGLTARYVSLRGRIVLMDRLAEDTLLPSPKGKSRLGALTDSLALRLQPTPDIVLVLDVPGELMFSRKGEHSPQKLEEWRRAYLSLAANLPSARMVDASQTVADVRREASRFLWHTLNAKWSAESVGSAALPLHLWTLIDWRFLLPVPLPGRVGYGGSVHQDVVEAVKLLDPTASRVTSDRSKQAREFDLVLLSEPDVSLLENGIRSLQSGGWICLQIRRSNAVGFGPHTLAGWKRSLEQSGFDDVHVYWLVPTLKHPERIVPTDAEAAVRDTIAHYSSTRFGRVKAPIARMALRLGLFDMAAPAGIVIGRCRLGTGGEGSE